MGGVQLIDHVAAALTGDAPREVGYGAAVRLVDCGGHVVVVRGRGLRAARGQNAGEDRQQRERDAAQAPHHAPPPVVVSPWSITDVWSVVAFATPWSVCTITESC